MRDIYDMVMDELGGRVKPDTERRRMRRDDDPNDRRAEYAIAARMVEPVGRDVVERD